MKPRTPLEVRFWKYVNKTETCWLWTGATREFGYGVINLGGRNGKVERAHRASWAIHCGPIPDGLCVCHRCDTPLCVRPNHLFLGTRADNHRDMQAKGRCDRVKRAKGERHGMAKLTAEQVKAIRDEYDRDANTLRGIAERHGVSLQQVFRIGKRLSWKHI